MWDGVRWPAAGAGRTDTPKIVDWYMSSKIAIHATTMHRLTLDAISKRLNVIHVGERIHYAGTY